ncbi:MAG: CCA tRNA nucleotidyltransferase [Candidatus Babeliales bacterium]
MNSINLTAEQQRNLDSILRKYPLVKKIVHEIDAHGGQALLVGGAVRDLLLGLPVKDLDIELHGLALNEVEKLLKKFGKVSTVGKVYGVLRVHKLDVDWSVPRTDASGRKPKVEIDPFMGIKKACARRDLTINAMAIDLSSKKLVDPWHGLKDLKKGILRAPDATLFLEDPLRFFRVMQFIGRFGFKPAKTLTALCKKMSIKDVSRERIETEFEKLLLKSKYPSDGIRWLAKIGRLDEILPELAATRGVKQEKSWHPEGDVFEHSMQALDAAAQLTYENDKEKLMMLYAALCHDLGKVTTTKKIKGVIKSLGHEGESAIIAPKMLKRITHNKDLIAAVSKLVRHHMQPMQFIENGARPPAYRRLAHALAPDITMEQLAKLAIADKRGRNSKSSRPLRKNFKDVQAFLKKAKNLKILTQDEKPLLQGRDLMDVAEPGPRMGALLKKAYDIQVQEGISDKAELKKRVLEE